jgi:hypothetical protein
VSGTFSIIPSAAVALLTTPSAPIKSKPAKNALVIFIILTSFLVGYTSQSVCRAGKRQFAMPNRVVMKAKL